MLPITKTKVPREFTVTKGHFKDLNLVNMVRKYATLRPSHTPMPPMPPMLDFL
jgi:hypothetical protein